MLYSAPGNIVDWMYARLKIKYSYTVHLRDTGTVRFFIHDQYILSEIFFRGYHFSTVLCCPRNGFDLLARRQLILLTTLQHL